MEKTNFDLEKTAAAIIFNNDMSVELVLPRMDDAETVDFETNQNIFVAMAIAALVDDKKFREFVGMKMQTMLETADALHAGEEDEAVDIPKCTCGPEDCSCEEC